MIHIFSFRCTNILWDIDEAIEFPHLVDCTSQYTLAMIGYDDEDKTTVLELTYNYGVTEYTKGNAYAQVS